MGRGTVNGVKTIAIAIACTSLSNLPVWVLTGLAPSIGAALGFGDVGLGAAIAMFFGVAAASAVPAGAVVERIGWRRGTLVASFLVGISLSGMGLAPHWPALIATLALGAVGVAFAQPCANVALAETVSLSRQGTAFGLKQASLPLTTLVVGVAVPLFLGENGWRWAFATAAGLTVVLIVVVLLVAWPRGERLRPPSPAVLRIRRSGPLRVITGRARSRSSRLAIIAAPSRSTWTPSR